MMVTKTNAIVLGMVLGCASAAAIAEVDSYNSDSDLKRYSAAGCGAQTAASSTVGTGGGIGNTSATAANNITCPVILDKFYNYSRYYYLTVLRAAGADPMRCYLSTRSGSSVTTTFQTVNTTGVETTMSFYRSGNDDAASLGCSIPKAVNGVRSWINRYYVSEY